MAKLKGIIWELVSPISSQIPELFVSEEIPQEEMNSLRTMKKKLITSDDWILEKFRLVCNFLTKFDLDYIKLLKTHYDAKQPIDVWEDEISQHTKQINLLEEIINFSEEKLNDIDILGDESFEFSNLTYYNLGSNIDLLDVAYKSLTHFPSLIQRHIMKYANYVKDVIELDPKDVNGFTPQILY